MYDYLIIGGSISAMSTALVLRNRLPNAKIALVGRFNDLNSASRCAGAMINCFAEVPYDAFKYPAMEQKFQFAYKSAGLWGSYVDKINEYSNAKIKKPAGKTYCILNKNSTAIERKTFDYILNTVGAKYEGIKELDPEEIKPLKPTDLGHAIRAMQVPDPNVNPHPTLAGLRSALENLNVKIIEDTVTECETDMFGGKIKSAKLASGSSLEAVNYIMANGFDQNSVMESLKKARVLPILANGGAALRLTVPDWVRRKGGLGKDLLELTDVMRMVDRGGACGIHIVPNGDGSFYLGASSAVWPNPEMKPKLAAVQVLMNSAINEISYELFYYDVEIIGNGFRPTTPDAFPIIGGTGIKNLWVNNGMKRDGFTSCWATSEYLVDGILAEKQDWGLFSPTRKLLSYKTRDEAFKSAMEMYQGSFVQHYGVQMPLRIPGERARITAEIEGVYKRVGSRDFGIHPEMLHIYSDNENYKIVQPYL
jgi:glycine oxidase